MQGHTKAIIAAMVMIFVVLGTMATIVLVNGDGSHTDKNNSDVDSNLGTPSARPSSENGSGR